MRSELAPPALRQRWRREVGEAVWLHIGDDINSIASDVVMFSAAGLLLTVLSMLCFPASASQIAVIIAQAC